LFSKFCLADCEEASDRCAAVGEWKISLALGAGVYTNPLHGGDNVPLIFIPKVSYYGEKLFFENNTLGYTFFSSEHLMISAITQLNHEKAYFTRWHPKNIFIESLSPAFEGDMSLTGENIKSEINIKDVPNRRWAIDAGVQLNWFINQTSDIQIQVLHDINNVYNGFNGQVQYSQIRSLDFFPDTVISYSLGADINSKELVNYYYGISEEDDLDIKGADQRKLNINPYFRVAIIHHLSKQWSVKLHFKQVYLDGDMVDSPLVKDNRINTIFAGVNYDF